jgi:hypothetical protein
MAVEDLTGQHISSTYQRLLQISSSGDMANGTGSLYIPPLSVTASYAISASYALSSSHEIVKEISSSHADTASYVNPLNQDVFINGDLTLTGSLTAVGSNFTFIGPITASTDISSSGDIISNNIFTGNINSSGSITHTGSINLLSSSISVVDYIDFNNTGITPPPDIEGRIYWDEDNGTLSLGMHGGQVVQQVGLEEYFYIKNQSGATIPNGSVVRAAGTLGASGRILGDLMIADGSITYYFTLGIATENIVNGDNGYVTQFGSVRGIDTTGTLVGETWNDGDVLWVSPTVLGGLTKVEPDSPNLKMQMAIVINAASNGTLFVRPTLSSFLADLHNVNDFTTTASFGDLLVKSGSTWINTKQLTGSYGLTGSIEGGDFSGSFIGDGSGLTGLVSSSYALTASYASNSELLDGRDSTTFTSTSSFNSFTSSYYTDSASFDTQITNNSASISSLSSSFLSFSSSYNTGSFTGSFIGSFSGNADLPDLTNSTGITSFTYDGSITATIQVSGSDTLSANTLPKWTGNALNDTNITDNGSVVAINSLTNITGSVDVLNGNVNLEANAYFFQGTSTGGSNVSLIGVNNQDQIYIGNQGFDNIIADDLAIQGDTAISGSLIVSGSAINDIQLFLPLTSSNDIRSSADIYGRTGSFDYLDVSTNISASGNITGNTGSFNYLNVEGDTVINGNTTLNGAVSFKTYRLTSSAYTASVDDYRIGVKYTLTGSVEIQLPLIATAGKIEYKFKDEEGNAKKQNITIIASGSDLIDGDVNAILNRNYMAIGLYNDGVSNWYIE